MLYCHICKKPFTAGWVVGFPPASDSLKWGLCLEHNTQENRLKTHAEWRVFMEGKIQEETQNKGYFRKDEELRLQICYSNGRMQTFSCISCKETQHNSLEVCDAYGKVIFIPLLQVKYYQIEKASPYAKKENKEPALP